MKNVATINQKGRNISWAHQLWLSSGSRLWPRFQVRGTFSFQMLIVNYKTKIHTDGNGLLREQGFGFILHTPERAYQVKTCQRKDFFEISFDSSFLRRRRSKEQSGPKRFRESWRLHFFLRWASSSLKSLILYFFPAQDNNLAVSLNKKRNDSIAFFNRWFQYKSWSLYRCLLSMEPRIDYKLFRVPIKPDLSQKHKSQRMKAALPCCCCCSTTKSLSLNIRTLSL